MVFHGENDKICQSDELLRSRLFPVLKQGDDLEFTQNVQLEFRQNLRHYCLL